ncbi:MAG: IS4 family transposase [Sphingobacteriales bacterium]|nr:MAG: IS4 family transposase [Sphingobacteriales bacterium]
MDLLLSIFKLPHKKVLMSKSSFFTGQPIFSQLINYIPRSKITQISREHQADRYCKRFKSYDHLITMLYGVFNRCDSLREITTGLLAWEQKLQHLGLAHYPRRSTLADANNRRSHEVFEAIYYQLYQRYQSFLSDSRSRQSRTYIFDSTTITLFSEVMKGVGLPDQTGRRKGGIKVHTLLRSDQDVPCMIRYSAATSNDVQFLKDVSLPCGSIIVFDRGYPDYTSYNRFNAGKVTWVTRLRSSTHFSVQADRAIPEGQRQKGVLEDKEILIGYPKKRSVKVAARLIRYYDAGCQKELVFITNNTRMHATTIASLYKQRWQIELLFKRIKQNYPLRYFLGESVNAIKIQIWCVLIADLLLKVIKKTTRSPWAFSNIASMVRLHLMTYVDLRAFMKSAEKVLLQRIKATQQTKHIPRLFDT